MEVLTEANNPHAFKVGEIFLLEGLKAHHACFIMGTLQYWAATKAIIEDISYLATPSRLHVSCPVIFKALKTFLQDGSRIINTQCVTFLWAALT